MLTPELPFDVELLPVSYFHEKEYLKGALESRELHSPWVEPPLTSKDFRLYLESCEEKENRGYVLCPKGSLEVLANMTIGGIVENCFQSGYLGYMVMAKAAGKGLMKKGIQLLLEETFTNSDLHRIEANIQPSNERSKGLIRSLGFRLEGYSPRYLKVCGEWRDHERWAMTKEDWLELNLI